MKPTNAERGNTMALSDDDLEKIGKLIENAVERRFEIVRVELHAEILEARQEANEHYIAIVQELQGAEKRLQMQINALKAGQARIQQVIDRIDAEHGGRLEQIHDGLTALYKREHQLEMRTEYLDAMFRQRFPPPQNP
jgi:hypothetical protein